MKENENVILLKLTLFWLKIENWKFLYTYVKRTAGLFKNFKILNKNSIHFLFYTVWVCVMFGIFKKDLYGVWTR